MNLVFLKKVSVVLVVMILCTQLSMMMNKNIFVRAGDYHDAQNVVGINASLMHSFCQQLSNIIHTEYDSQTEIPKGRWFGSNGEHAAYQLINNTLSAWGINTKVDQIETDSLLLQRKHNLVGIQSNLEITDNPDKYSFTIHDTTTSTDTELDDSEFYITPQWKDSYHNILYPFRKEFTNGSQFFKLTNYEDLSGIITINNAKLYPRPNDFIEAFLLLLEDEKDILINHIVEHPAISWMALFILLILLLAEEYDFNFADVLNDQEEARSRLPWYNTTIGTAESNFMFIGEDPSFNPYKSEATPDWSFYDSNARFKKYATYLEMWFWRAMYGDYCQGLILYENQYNSANETHNMVYSPFHGYPIVYIDHSTGSDLLNNIENCEVSVGFEQEWKNDIESYNVIGEIEGTCKKETVLLTCLYDGLWSEATIDSATGMSIVMAIAQYARAMQTDYDINPKYDLKFVAFGGEEAGLRGAYDYVKRYKKPLQYPEERHLTVIDLNQLGYGQQWPPQTLYCIYNNNDTAPILENLTKQSHYTQRTDDYTKFETISTYDWHPYSDYTPFYERDEIFPLWNANTICLLKENATKPRSCWRQHHRTNKDYTKGDSMNLYNRSFINISGEIIWNLTRYYAYNPNCWFKNKQDFEKTVGDSNNDGKPDWVNLTFEIDTIMPHDRVTVLAQLVSTWYPFLAEKTQSYSIDRSGLSHYVNLSLDNSMPLGAYFVQLYLFNSTGEINNITDNPDKFWRGLLKYSNDTYLTADITMAPYNAAPTVQYTPSSPQGININAGTQTTYTTGGTDPNNNPVYYQWLFTDNATDITEYTEWLGPYDSGENCTYNRIWTIPGNYTVQVRMRDIVLTPYLLSNSSESYYANVAPGVSFIVPSIVIINQSFDVNGITHGFDGSGWTWKYSFNQSEQTKEGQNQSHTYEDIQNNTIALTVNNSETVYTFNQEVDVVHVIADFTVNDTIVKPTIPITFNGTYMGELENNGWYWDFDDGTNATTQNTTHSYTNPGIYNVTLTVTDTQDRTANYTTTLYVDADTPSTISSTYTPHDLTIDEITDGYYPLTIGYNQDITIHADVHDELTQVTTAMVNITYPDGTTTNQSMEADANRSSDFELDFTGTNQIGGYTYRIWTVDEAENINSSDLYLFEVDHLFGKTTPGPFNISIKDSIKGTSYTAQENGTAEYIKVYLQTNETPPAKVQCMIYQNWDLIGTTEEKNISTGDTPQWIIFNFTGTKPSLEKDTPYWLRCWSNDTCAISYNTASNASMISYTYNETYDGTPPETIITWTQSPPPPDYFRNYSIYCKYSNKPLITDISNTPNTRGFGYNVTITAKVTDVSGLADVVICMDYPNASYSWENDSMTPIGNDIYQYVFEDTWLVGQYNYTIWATDVFGNVNSSSEYSFNVSADATISIATIYDAYENGSSINLTDPPVQPITIGHEILDNSQILHIWNKYDHYYLDTESGIQLTNHKDDYWSQNVLMLGYYNNDQWNLIYQTDELSGFTKSIQTDNQTYVNATLWKDLSYNGYDFRLAIRYHLGINDNELTIIPYIKNLGSTIPYQLGFGWAIKDIQIDMTPENDYIEIDDTSYYLNTTLDESYTTLDETRFTIKEDITPNRSESLYMIWNDSLNYKLTVKSQENQSNAPVTLFIKIGTLNSGQEKYTELLWHDAAEITYYFASYGGEGDPPEAWTTNPSYMVDGSIGSYATATTGGEVELCDGNTCPGDNLGTISAVTLRVYGNYSGVQRDIMVRPVYGGITDGEDNTFRTVTTGQWSEWFDITNEGMEILEGVWTWTDVKNLDCDIEAEDGLQSISVHCSRVELKVEFTGDTSTEIYHYIKDYESNWEYPDYMVDEDEETFAYTDNDGIEQICLTSSCEGDDFGTIYQVELRACGMREGTPSEIFITPVFNGTGYGESHVFQLPEGEPGWSDWYDITNDPDAPGVWNWSDITALDCHVESNGTGEFLVLCSKIEVRVSSVEPPNNAPGVGNPSPSDNQIDVSLTPIVSIVVSDADGDTLDITWLSNSSGSWQTFGTNNSVNPGTYYQTFSNATVNGQWWYWRVNVSDGKNYTLSNVYKFYTGKQSKLVNTGSYDCHGYLFMDVQKYNSTSTNWTSLIDIFYDGIPRNLSASGDNQTIAFDTLFNGLFNTSILWYYGNGTYRFYVAFMNPYDEVLITNDEKILEATYEFTITFD